MREAKIVRKLDKKKHQADDDMAVPSSSAQEGVTSVTANKRSFERLQSMPGTESLIVKKIKEAICLDSKMESPSVHMLDSEIASKALSVDECIKSTPKNEGRDSSDLDYGVRLKEKYQHLKIKDIADRLGVNVKSLSGKINRKKKMLALDEQPKLHKKTDYDIQNEGMDIEECVKLLEDSGESKDDQNFGVYLKNSYPHLVIKHIADYLGVKESTMKDRIYRAKFQGGVSKTLEKCMVEMPFEDSVYTDAVDYGIQLKNKYSHLNWEDIAKKLNVSKNTMKMRVQQKKKREASREKGLGNNVLLQKIVYSIDGQKSVLPSVQEVAADCAPSTSATVYFLPKKQAKGKLSVDINECIRDTPRETEDSDDFTYAIKLKKKYLESLTYSALALHFNINKNTLMARATRTSKNATATKSVKNADIDECMRNTPREGADLDVYDYAIRLKLKYGFLSYRALEEKLPGVKRTTLEGKLKSYISDGKAKDSKTLNVKECLNILIDEGKARYDDKMGFYLKKRFPSLSVRGIEKELNMAPGTLRYKIKSIEENSSKEGDTLTVDDCMSKMPFDESLYTDKYEYGILLQSKFSHLPLTKIAIKLGLSQDSIQKRRDAMRRRIEKGEREVDLSSMYKKRKELRASFKLKKDVGISVKNEMKLMCKDSHEELQDIEQKRSTTALGIDMNGKYYLASSDAYMKASMRAWANDKGVSIVMGEGHAEEKILRKCSDIVHVEASRDICLECEIKLLENCVGTTTGFSGKPSQKVMRDIQKTASSSNVMQ